MAKNLEQKEQELVAAIGILPVLADFLEDLNFSQTMKMKVNHTIASIRSLDNYIMRYAPIEVVEEQHNVALWFRNELKKLRDERQDSTESGK
jgi:hypothetical protein